MMVVLGHALNSIVSRSGAVVKIIASIWMAVSVSASACFNSV